MYSTQSELKPKTSIKLNPSIEIRLEIVGKISDPNNISFTLSLSPKLLIFHRKERGIQSHQIE